VLTKEWEVGSEQWVRVQTSKLNLTTNEVQTWDYSAVQASWWQIFAKISQKTFSQVYETIRLCTTEARSFTRPETVIQALHKTFVKPA